MKRKFYLGFMLMLSILLVAVGCSSNNGGNTPAPGTGQGSTGGQSTETPAQEPVTLKIVSFLAMDHVLVKDVVPMWIEKLEEATNGVVTGEWVGGPESVPVKDQFDAVGNGIVDAGFNVSAYMAHLMPEVHSMHMSPFSGPEERENGYYDYLNERFNLHNVEYAGRWLPKELPFHFFFNEKVDNIADMKGLKLRSNPTYHEILIQLGINPVEVTPADVYTSLERNMVDGFGWGGLLGPRASGWTEISKYVLDEPFLNQHAAVIINKDVYDQFTPEVQEQIQQANVAFEEAMIEYFTKAVAEERQTLIDSGSEFVKLSDEDSKRFQQIVDEVYWNMMEETAADQVPTLEEFFK